MVHNLGFSLEPKNTWLCDLETDGLKPSRIWCAVIRNLGSKDRIYQFVPDEYLKAGRYSLEKDFPKFLEKESNIIVGHNFYNFDYRRAIYPLLGIEIPKERIVDTLVYSRFANPMREGGHSLENWGNFFNVKKPGHDDWSQFSEEMLVRCTMDTLINWYVVKQLAEELKGFLASSLELAFDIHILMDKCTEDGFKLDDSKAMLLLSETKARADQLQDEIRKAFPKRSRLIKEVNPKVTKKGLLYKNLGEMGIPIEYLSPFASFSLFEWEDFNLDSPLQRVKRLLDCGWKPTKFTKPSKTHPNGQPSFDEDDLDSVDIPEAKLLGEYLMCRSRERTVRSWLDLRDSNGFVHGEYVTNGTWTGRMRHANPNMANIPKVKREKDGTPKLGSKGKYGYECRSCWTTDKTDDCTLLGVDLSGIQLRAFAHYVGNLEYIRKIEDPEFDPHQFHADALGCTRDTAKTFLYAMLMGAGFRKLGQVLGGDLDRGKQAFDSFQTIIPGLKEFKDTHRRIAQTGYLTALDGSRKPIESAHLVMPAYLQSFEACVMNRALVEFFNTAPKNSELKLRTVVHDELVASVRREWAEDLGKKFALDIVPKVGVSFGSQCKLIGAYHVGNSWAEIH